MTLVLVVALISGETVSLEADLDASVGSVKLRGRGALGVGLRRLLKASGSVLDGDATLETAGLRTGDRLTLQIGKLQIQAGKHQKCFAAIIGDGSVVT